MRDHTKEDIIAQEKVKQTVEIIKTISEKYGFNIKPTTEENIYELSLKQVQSLDHVESANQSKGEITKDLWSQIIPSNIVTIMPSVCVATPSFRNRLEDIQQRIQVEQTKLDQLMQKCARKDKILFSNLVLAYTKHDGDKANNIATELAEVRKMTKLIMNASFALESVVSRINSSVSDAEKVFENIGPAVGVLNSVKPVVAGLIPDRERRFVDINNMLSGIIVEAGQGSGRIVNFESFNHDAEKILGAIAFDVEIKFNALNTAKEAKN